MSYEQTMLTSRAAQQRSELQALAEVEMPTLNPRFIIEGHQRLASADSLHRVTRRQW
jgi:hypothetical protein